MEAYCFDSAVTRWGVSLEAALQSATKGADGERSAERAQERVVRRWLKLVPGADRPQQGQIIQG